MLIDEVENVAKEAREILEGEIIVLLETLETAIKTLIESTETVLKEFIKGVSDRAGVLETWVNNSHGWLNNQLDLYKEKIVGFVVDSFENILDRIFEDKE